MRDRLLSGVGLAQTRARHFPAAGVVRRVTARRSTTDQLRPRPLGPRELEALRIVEERPGITVGELREELSVGESRIWQIVGRLEQGQVRREQPAPPPRDEELNVKVHPRNLPPSVAALRERAAEVDRREWEVARPRIETHMTTYGLVVGHLESLHMHIVDTTDLDPAGYSRPAAMWLMAGRCLGLLRSALMQVNAGICGEALVTLRALHEATELLWALGNQDEDELLRTWLDDEGRRGYVAAGQAREAHARFENKLAEAMRHQGLGELKRSTPTSGELYDLMSRAGHNRRSSVLDAWWAEGREMTYGPHRSALRRAAYVSMVGVTLHGLVAVVGDALSPLLPPGVWAQQWPPLRASVEAMDTLAPLDKAAIRRAAGTG